MKLSFEIATTQKPCATPLRLKTTISVMTLAFVLGACSSNGGGKSLNADNVSGLATAGASVFKAATLTDTEVKEYSDKSCAAMDAKSKIAAPKSKEATRLAKIIKGMPGAVNGVQLQYKVYLTKDVNAWAMNNGCVRVYSGLMSLMNDDEVRGVIGHEIGHVALGHSKSRMQTAYSAAAARQVAAASGNQAAAALSNSQFGEMAEALINAQFSQSQETDSDDYSFDLLLAGKFKLDGLVTAFEKLAKLGDSSSMFSSHPSSSGRAQHIRDRIAAKK